MLKRTFMLTLCALALVILASSSNARAAVIADYFDYGGSSANLDGQGTATEGWTGDWTRSNASYGPAYTAGARLVFSNPDYNNGLNPVGSGATQTGTGNLAHPSERSLESTGEGEVWISLLAKLSDVSAGFNSRAGVWLNFTGTSSGVRFGMADEDTYVQMGSSANQVIVQPGLNNNEVYLWLAKLTIDATGNDQLDFWVKSSSDDISSAAALGAPLVSNGGFNYFGTAGLTRIGVGFQSDLSTFDALRISNDLNAFQLVTLGYTPIVPVPEPASLTMLALGSLLLLRRKRKSRA